MSQTINYRLISSTLPGVKGFTGRAITRATVDAKGVILPRVIDDIGAKVGDGVAWEIITKFLKRCSDQASQGDTVNIEGMLSFTLVIEGLYPTKDARVNKNSLKVGIQMLKDLKPAFDVSLRNVLEGDTLRLFSITGEGAKLGEVVPGAPFRINGEYLTLLEGDSVVATATVDGHEYTAECAVSESAIDHITAQFPQSLAWLPAGTSLTITVNGRCGDEEGAVQTQSRTVKIVAYSGEHPLVASVQDGELEPDTVTFGDSVITVRGAGLSRTQMVKFGVLNGTRIENGMNASDMHIDGDSAITCKLATNSTTLTDEQLLAAATAGTLVIAAMDTSGFANPLPVKYVVAS